MSKKSSFFWASYSDLMTSLFFIMLVLFVLTVVMLKKEQGRIIAKLDEYQKIEEIKKFISTIDTSYFEYRPEYKKHILKLQVEYKRDSFNINSRSLRVNSFEAFNKMKQSIVNSGLEIKNTIERLPEDENIQYLIVIEGQASRDGYHGNDVLSYQRALQLKKFWESNGIYLDRIENCELVVAGSGEGGIPRDSNNEAKNRRFLIHIIPKTGVIKNH